jgi:hypothetical protein
MQPWLTGSRWELKDQLSAEGLTSMATHMVLIEGRTHFETFCGLRMAFGDDVALIRGETTCELCLAEYRATEFTDADHRDALRQGWLLGERTIERDDDMKRFPDDNAAAAYVIGRAETGCRLARKALRYYGKRPRRRMNGTWVKQAVL